MSGLSAFTASVPYNYEKYLGPLFFEPYAVDMVKRIDFGKSKNILEIACGTGRVTKHLAQNMGDGTRLVASDLNPDMIEEGRSKVIDPRIEWVTANAQELPFDNSSFDLVVCQYGVMFFPEKEKAFSEILRVLKNGGVFVFNTWDELPTNKLSYITNTLVSEMYPSDPPDFFKKGPYSFYDTSRIFGMLSAAGFDNIDIEKVSLESRAESLEGPVNGIVEGTPLFGYLTEKQASIPDVKKKLSDRLSSEIQGDIIFPMTAIVCVCQKPV